MSPTAFISELAYGNVEPGTWNPANGAGAAKSPVDEKSSSESRIKPKTMRSYFAGSNCAGNLTQRITADEWNRQLRARLAQAIQPKRQALEQLQIENRDTGSAENRAGIEPIPPRMTIARTPMDSMKVKLSGLINTCLAANNTPTAEANDAPTANPSSFIRTTGTPMAAAASSSSRIAFQARPTRESSSRRVTIIMTQTSSSTRK